MTSALFWKRTLLLINLFSSARRENWPPPPPDERFPFYVHVPSGIRSLDHSVFFQLLGRTFDARRTFYCSLFSRSSKLKDYLFALYAPALLDDLGFILGSRYLKPALLKSLADCYATALVGNFVRWTCDSCCESVEESAIGLDNILHRTMSYEIEEQRLFRQL